MNKKLSLFPLLALLFSFAILFHGCDLFNDDDENEDPNDPPPQEEIGLIKWTWSSPGDVGISSSPALDGDGTVYVACGGGTGTWVATKVFAVKDSITVWTSPELDHIGASSDIVIGDDGLIYVIGYLNIYALNKSNGTIDWQYEVPDPHKAQIGNLALGEDGHLFFSNVGSGAYQRALFCVKDGVLLWSTTKETIYGASHLAVAGNGNLLCVWKSGNDDKHYIECRNPGTGALLWATAIDGYLSGGNTISLDNSGDVMVTSTFPDKVYRLSITNGEILMEKELLAAKLSHGPNGNFYSFIFNSGLKCFSANGDLLWEAENGLSGSHGVAVDNQNNTIVVGWGSNYDGNLQVFNSSGELRWAQNTVDMQYSPLVGSNGKIYVAGGYLPGKIQCVQGEYPLASTWARAEGNNRNTRRK